MIFLFFLVQHPYSDIEEHTEDYGDEDDDEWVKKGDDNESVKEEESKRKRRRGKSSSPKKKRKRKERSPPTKNKKHRTLKQREKRVKVIPNLETHAQGDNSTQSPTESPTPATGDQTTVLGDPGDDPVQAESLRSYVCSVPDIQGKIVHTPSAEEASSDEEEWKPSPEPRVSTKNDDEQADSTVVIQKKGARAKLIPRNAFVADKEVNPKYIRSILGEDRASRMSEREIMDLVLQYDFVKTRILDYAKTEIRRKMLDIAKKDPLLGNTMKLLQSRWAHLDVRNPV